MSENLKKEKAQSPFVLDKEDFNDFTENCYKLGLAKNAVLKDFVKRFNKNAKKKLQKNRGQKKAK